MLTRRRLLALAPAAVTATLIVGVHRPASARASVRVTVPAPGIGAIAAAEGRDLVSVIVDESLAATQIRIGDAAPIDVGAKLRLKGSGAARERFLDDARNATLLGSAIRDALTRAMPEHRKVLDDNHTAWARPFARKALGWSRALQGSKVTGKKVRDEYARVYLLEWAGATIDPRGQRAPGGLSKAPRAPSGANLAAYERYLDALVAALV